MFTIYITSRQSYMTIQGGTLQLDPTRTFYDGDRAEERTSKLLGHITRREDGDPLKQAILGHSVPETPSLFTPLPPFDPPVSAVGSLTAPFQCPAWSKRMAPFYFHYIIYTSRKS